MRLLICTFSLLLFLRVNGSAQDQKKAISVVCTDKNIYYFKKDKWDSKALEGKIIEKFTSNEFIVIITDKKAYVFYSEGEKIDGEYIQDLGKPFLDCQIKSDHVLILIEGKMFSFFVNKTKVMQCVKKDIIGANPFIIKPINQVKN
ncbi:MAG: hypothetical protein Q8K92_06120 [Leadbetterella sp.]|nr:hypothetical protein [Leadbetterella sp.]